MVLHKSEHSSAPHSLCHSLSKGGGRSLGRVRRKEMEPHKLLSEETQDLAVPPRGRPQIWRDRPQALTTAPGSSDPAVSA